MNFTYLLTSFLLYSRLTSKEEILYEENLFHSLFSMPIATLDGLHFGFIRASMKGERQEKVFFLIALKLPSPLSAPSLLSYLRA